MPLPDILFCSKNWEEEEILYSKISLIYHLSENVLDDFNQLSDDKESDASDSKVHEDEEGDCMPPSHISEANLAKLACDLRVIYADNRSESSSSVDGDLSEWSSDGESCHETQEGYGSICSNELTQNQSKPSNMNILRTSVRCLVPKFGFPIDEVPAFPALEQAMAQPCALGIACIRSEVDELEDSSQRYSVTDEQCVVREVLHMLSGLPSRLFFRLDSDQSSDFEFQAKCREYFPERGQDVPFKSIFLPRKGILVSHLSPSALLSILSQFGEQGTMLCYLRQACDKYILPGNNEPNSPVSRGCSTIHAFFASVHAFYLAFECFLQELLLSLLRNTTVHLPRYGYIEDSNLFSRSDANAASITLLSLKLLLRSRVALVEELCDICERILQPEILQSSSAEQASHLLQLLYSVLHESKLSANSSRTQFLAKIFHDTFTPYVMIIDDWLYHGSLQSDVHNEFIVHCSDMHLSQDVSVASVTEQSTGKGINFWQCFAIRNGGKRIHSGHLRGATADYLTLSLSASTSDDYYAGMSISLDITGDKGFQDCGIITSYFGSKRRAIVEFGKIVSVAEGCSYAISTLVPRFLQDLAFQILSAGKSLNVLILESNASRMYDLVHQEPSLYKSFQSFVKDNQRDQTNLFNIRVPSLECIQSNETKCSFMDSDGSTKTFLRQNMSSHRELRSIEHGPGRSLKDLFVSSLEDSDVWAEPRDSMRSEFCNEQNDSKVTSLPCSSLSSFLCSSMAEEKSYIDFGGIETTDLCRSGAKTSASTDDLLTGHDSMLLPQILDNCFLRHVKRRVRELNSALVKHIIERHQLLSHLAALRRIFFMEAGDILHAFSLELFRKLDRGEPWGDAHSLDVMLQSSLPSIGVELGSVSACMMDGSHHTASVPSSILALDRLQLSYSVGWPLNLVINSSSLATYNSIMVFLMQIKRAKCALDHMRDKPFTKPLRLGVPISAQESVADQNKCSSICERYGQWNSRYLLLRAELRHVVNNVENYVMSQIHGTAASNLERQLLQATALDQVMVGSRTKLLTSFMGCLIKLGISHQMQE